MDMNPAWKQKNAVPKSVLAQAHGNADASDLSLDGLEATPEGDVDEAAFKRFACQLANSLRVNDGTKAFEDLVNQISEGAHKDPRLLELALASASLSVTEVQQCLDSVVAEIRAWSGGPGKELDAMELERDELDALVNFLAENNGEGGGSE